MENSFRFEIVESTQVGEARREAYALAMDIGFRETQSGKVAIVTTELANNILNHAKKGELLLRIIERKGATAMIRGLELLALDQGPGIKNISESMRDGVSTRDTPGTGLGAVARLSDYFDLYSQEGAGTAVLAQLWPSPVLKEEQLRRSIDAPEIEIGAVSVPHPHETLCGDSWVVKQNSPASAGGPNSGNQLVLIADGLGHGPQAAKASLAAVDTLDRTSELKNSEILKAINLALRSTRGAAVAIAAIDPEKRVIHYTGAGNIAGAILTASSQKRLMSLYGTAGLQIQRIQTFDYAWPEGAVLIMHSDGLTTRCCELDDYPGLLRKHASLIAGVLYRDFKRGSDDITIVVIREKAVRNAA